MNGYLWLLSAWSRLMHGKAITIAQVVLSFTIDSELATRPIGPDPKYSRALAVAVSYFESGGRINIMATNGDGGTCAFQVTPGRPSMLEDAEECTREGLGILRASYKLDPIYPVAAFARGSLWRTDEARRLSDQREELAELLYITVTP